MRGSLWFRQSPSFPPRGSVHSWTEEDFRTPYRVGAHEDGASKVPLNPVVPPACIPAEGRKRFADPAGTYAFVGAAITQWCLRHHRDMAPLRRRMLASEHRERPRRDRSCRRSGIPSAVLQAPSTPWLIVPFQAPEYTRLRLEAPTAVEMASLQGIAPVTAIGPGSKFRPDRCRQLSRPLLQSARHPHGRARRAARKCQFPPQFSPLWKPPFPDPPSKLESTKGGQTAGGTGTAAVMARLKSPRGPLSPRSRAPPPYGFPGHSAAWTPLRRGPRGAGRVRLCGEGSFLTPPHTVMEALRFPSPNSPLAPYAPRRGAARWFAGRAGLRARAPPQTEEGGDPLPPRARSRRRPALPIRP